MIDWAAAERIAGFVAGSPGHGPALGDDLGALAADAAERVSAYTELAPATALPPPEAVSRQQWIAANLTGMRPLLDPLSDRMGAGLGALAAPLRLVTGLALAAQVGALTGYLSQRVLGQYDTALLGPDRPARLLLVAPNLDEAAQRLGARRDELLRWVTLHEVTHAVQFTAVPWLRGHLGGLLRELLEGLELRLAPRARRGALRLPAREDLRELVELLRRGDFVTAALGPERRAALDQVQATMALVEGHAEHVMDAVGAQVLNTQAAMREAFEQRRDARAPLVRVLERLLGLDLKLRQYRLGKRFCDEIVAERDIATLNRAWSEPAALPTLAELSDSAAWLRRVAV